MTSCAIVAALANAAALALEVGHGTRHDSGMGEVSRPRVLPLIVLAGAATLAVTAMRVVGERNHWDERWFDPSPGSPMCPFGIVWLVPLFGFLFGRRFAQLAAPPPFVKRFFVPMFALLALVLVVVWVGSRADRDQQLATAQYLWVGGPALASLGLFAWPRVFLANLTYGALARAPVVVVQYLDIENAWQTHYGRLPAVFDGVSADERFALLAMAQACGWLPFTVLLGGGAAALGAATIRR